MIFISDLKIFTLNTPNSTYWQFIDNAKVNINKSNIYYKD